MGEVIPRWEWRTFGDHFGAAEARLAALEAGNAQQSDELYLLSSVCDANVKIRDGLMDVKRLEHTDAHGLEQWRPVMKGAFPLPAAEAEQVFAALGVAPPPLARAAYALEQLLDELLEPEPGLRAVRVHKKRTRYTIDGCMAELTEVVADGKAVRTVAVESEDPVRVLAAVRTLGLEGVENVSYPRGLKRLAGMATGGRAMPRYAVIDIGTNSVKFHIGERASDGTWRKVIDRAEVTRLGEGLRETGEIGAQVMERTVAAIASMAAEARQSGAVAIAAVGTMGLRSARNADRFIEAVRSRCGVAIEVIPGEEEGRLAYLAVKAGLGLPEGPLVVFDTGGGSTQFTFGHGATVDERFSLNVGAVRYTERYALDGAVADATLREALSAIGADLVRLDSAASPDALVGMGGAVTNMAAVKLGLATYDPDAVQGTVLARSEIDRQIELYRSRPAAARRAIVGLQPGRAEVILAGACIVRTVMEKLRRDALSVSDRGLRHGLLVDRFSA